MRVGKAGPLGQGARRRPLPARPARATPSSLAPPASPSPWSPPTACRSLISAGEWIAAVHAGWRGIVAGVVAATVRRLAELGAADPAAWTAWIGPAIGGCCYEVGSEVAEQVAAASTTDAVLAWPDATKPHLDLARAVLAQLTAAGVTDLHPLVSCTQCDRERLWSYRRDGTAAGRNVALIWKTQEA